MELLCTIDHKVVRAPAFRVEDLSTEDKGRLEEILHIVDRLLPGIEREVVKLTFLRRKAQWRTGIMLGVPQEMVAYWLGSAVRRIRWWIEIRRIDLQRMDEFLRRFVTPGQAEAVMLYLRHGNQTEVGRIVAAPCTGRSRDSTSAPPGRPPAHTANARSGGGSCARS